MNECTLRSVTNLEEAEFVGSIRRADDNCFHISYVDISACDCKSCSTEPSVSPSRSRNISSCGKGTYRGQRISGYLPAPTMWCQPRPHYRWRPTHPCDADDGVIRHLVGDQGSVEESQYIVLLRWLIRRGDGGWRAEVVVGNGELVRGLVPQLQ